MKHIDIRGERNIRNVLKKATSGEWELGMGWYGRAHGDAQKIANRYRLPTEKVVGVIAALSPQKAWKVNLEAAERLIKGWRAGLAMEEIKVAAYGAMKLKAWAILTNPLKPVRWNFNPKTGPKIFNFFMCIGNPDSRVAVCIDTHAYAVWDDFRHRSGNYGAGTMPGLTKKGRYEEVAEGYRNIAKLEGILPMQCQAICWGVWKRMKGIKG